MLIIKSFVILMLLFIFASLFSALVLLFRRGPAGPRTGLAKALTWRIGLSLALFFLLMAGFYFGVIPPEGLSPAPGR
ncbi:MAG TPA: DUF2909 domain-containing protein [Burkholderiales bacterium]